MLLTLLIVPSLLVLLPSLVLFIECVAARRGRQQSGSHGLRPSVAVLIPAHDEEADIATTVRQVRGQLQPGDRLLVVADNCADQTAQLAAQAGAEVVVRTEADRRGKGFALACGVQHLGAQPPEVVIVVDADCQVSPGALDRLGRQALASGRPVQAEYVLSAPGGSDARAAVSAMAFLLRNQVRMRGLHALGQPCQLTGSGMAFPWSLLRDAPPLHDNLVEDMVLGVHLALAGAPPLHCAEVSVTSLLPCAGRAQLGQRRRWEHGHLATLTSFAPRLLFAGLRRMRLDVCVMALDLMVPPLALLVMTLLGLIAVDGLAWLLGAPAIPLLISALALGLVASAVASAWWRFGRLVVPARSLLAVPGYLLWKIPLYLGFALRGRHRSWERTARSRG